MVVSHQPTGAQPGGTHLRAMATVSRNPKWTKEERESKTTVSRFRPSNSMTLNKKPKISRDLVTERREKIENANTD